jgi:hypothetical protein
VLTNDVINLRALANVVQGTATTSTTNNTSTYADTGLTVTITPTSNTSNVLVLVALQFVKSGNTGVNFRILRGATVISENQYVGYTNSALENHEVFATHRLDSPATTSATIYKVQFASQANIAAAQVCSFGTAALSTIIVQEIPT